MLGAEVSDNSGHFQPAETQYSVIHRVADCIEACCDEWLDNWQEGPTLQRFWDQAACRLMQNRRFFRDVGISAIELCKIVMTYVPRWDPDGRGASEEESQWGFQLGDLTWGNRRAELDPFVLAKPWVCFLA